MRKTEFDYLNGFESVKKLRQWLLTKAGRKEWFSERSFLQYLRGVRDFMVFVKADSPDGIMEALRGSQGKAEGVVSSWVRSFSGRDWSPSTQIHFVAYLKRFLSVNDVEVDWRKINLPKLRYVVQDKAPDKRELRTLLMYAPSWLKPVVLLLVASGLRVGSLEKLKLKHVKFDFDPHVGLVEVPPEATKAKVGYYTFFTDETKEALKKHLETRKKNGEVLTEDSPLIKPPQSETATYACIRLSYNRTLRRAGLTKKSMSYYVLHIHSLRKFFRTQLEAILTRSQIERLMGHVSSEYLDGSYFRPPEKDMLQNYRNALPNLTILEDVESEEFQKKQLLRQAALILPEDKLRMLKDILARTKNIDEAVHEFRRFKDGPETMRDGNGKYHVAKGEAELMQRLSAGWKLVQTLNHDKYLLQKSSGFINGKTIFLSMIVMMKG